MHEPAPPAASVLARLGGTPLIDGHNDTPWQIRQRFGGRVDGLCFRDTTALEPPMHTDLRRLRAGGVGAQFWAAYVPVEAAGAGAARVMLEQIDVVWQLARRYPEELAMAASADELERVHGAGRIACLIGVEGGHGLEGSPAVLRCAWRCGARYLTLTHNRHTEWADSATEEPRHGGLTEAGRDMVRELNRLGMMVDLSHTAEATMRDALETSRAPVVFTHSGARAVTDHPRNVPDAILETVRDRGGLVMATFVPHFVSAAVRDHRATRDGERARAAALHPADAPARERLLAEWDAGHPAPRATVGDVADHLDHLRAVMGPEHVGIGSDFDGIAEVPEGLEDTAAYPALLSELVTRGWPAADLRLLAGGNLLRVLRAAEALRSA